MGSPFGKAIVIANPRSGKGRVGRDPGGLESVLGGAGLDFDLRLTERAGHATELARRALDDGHTFLVAAGGDGTIHEVINGMMDDAGPVSQSAVLGVLPTGSGSDFIRTFGLPSQPEDAVKNLLGNNLFEIDVGRITYGNPPTSRYFGNIAEAGFGAEVVKRAEALPRFLGRARYLWAFWLTFGAFAIRDCRVVLDDQEYEGSVTNLVVANCQFFGGGMHIAPKAHPADGRFDVLLQRGSKRDYVEGVFKVFKAEHLKSPAIKVFSARRVEIQSSRPLRVEADGELLGTTPATFEILEKAIKLKL